MVASAYYRDDAITVTWRQPLDTPPGTYSVVNYCPTSSPNCGDGAFQSRYCTSPCTISGLDPDTEYQFTVIPYNYCGSPTGCTENSATAQTAGKCEHPFVCACVNTYLLE